MRILLLSSDDGRLEFAYSRLVYVAKTRSIWRPALYFSDRLLFFCSEIFVGQKWRGGFVKQIWSKLLMDALSFGLDIGWANLLSSSKLSLFDLFAWAFSRRGPCEHFFKKSKPHPHLGKYD